jgi:pimeloyl-ACP methyl ester carboxylesterase
MTTHPNVTSGERIERTIIVQDIETHLFEAGPTSAQPVLFLHGAHSGNLWLDYHRALAQQFHVFAPDLPGFGLTPRPDWMRDISDYVLFMQDLIRALDLQQPHLIGHSLGGWMAAELAVWYPEMIGKLVLCNAAGLRVKGSPMGDLFALNPQEALALCFEHLDAAAPLIPAEITTDFLMTQYRENITLALLMWNPNYDPQLGRRLARITCPTLIIWGEKDRLLPPVYGETWHQLIPGSILISLPDTGHMPMFERLEDWTRHVVTFLQAHEGAAHE